MRSLEKRKLKMSNETLENYCNSIVDPLYADFSKSLFFIPACQGKNGNVYLRIKKRVRILNENKLRDFKMAIQTCIKTCYNFYFDSDFSLKEHYFDFRIIKTNSGYHFQFICLCKDKYINRFWN